VRALLRELLKQKGGKVTFYICSIAATLLQIAKDWVRLSADDLEALRRLRLKLGPIPPGLTPKNQKLLRQFDDPALVRTPLQLPDRLWRGAGRQTVGFRAFLQFQNALAIDLLMHAPLWMANLSTLTFERHLQWPAGPGKPALLVMGSDETKNRQEIDFEIPTRLADRLLAFRNSIAPKVIGSKPNNVFVTLAGTPRSQDTLAHAISHTARARVGVKLTPHQFRHLAAKIYLDQNPGAFELVRQLLGHTNLKTTIGAYAGIDTRRAGRAHAQVLEQLKEQHFARHSRFSAVNRQMRGRSTAALHLPFADWPEADKVL